ncbi:MAG: 16S rRNA (guanine(527)-N(7))-methyltransferase RsmG [Deltaproteobacteria bacterium]|nr:16S rRNA (guanine(527)-N(7))-methyltransferase RsmG [Deltaproteobacteria bacterium]
MPAETKNSELMRQAAACLDLNLTDETLDRFMVYLAELKKWNKIASLTSITGDRDIILKHFIDSLTILPFSTAADNLADLGAGAGFPSFPLGIVAPDLAITVVESSAKKINFLRYVSGLLGLKKIRLIHGDIFHPPPGLPGHELVTARALTAPEKMFTISQPYLNPHGRLIIMAGPGANVNHLSAGAKPFKLVTHLQLCLPISGDKRQIFVFSTE